MQPAVQKVSKVLIAESLEGKSLGSLFEISEGDAVIALYYGCSSKATSGCRVSLMLSMYAHNRDVLCHQKYMLCVLITGTKALKSG